MKVSNSKIGNTSGLTTGNAGRAEGANSKKEIGAKSLFDKSTVQDSANVNVSERAQMMAKAKEIASGPMTVDEAKVARLQKMIDEGKYKVDAEAIADRLVDEHMTIPD